MSIYITGDLHGDLDRIINNEKIGKGDYLIALGDVGLILEPRQTIKEILTIEKIKRKGFTFLFISGNHDNEDRLDKYPVNKWNGGNAHIIAKKKDGSPAIVHLMRGQVYEFEGKQFFAFGGARPHEKNLVVLDKKSPSYRYDRDQLIENGVYYRVKGVDYWERCLPSETEMQEGIANLRKVNYRAQYVLTHCAPTHIQNVIYSGDDTWTDRQTDYLKEISELASFDKWLFGHYHSNKEYENGLFQCVYDDIIEL